MVNLQRMVDEALDICLNQGLDFTNVKADDLVNILLAQSGDLAGYYASKVRCIQDDKVVAERIVQAIRVWQAFRREITH